MIATHPCRACTQPVPDGAVACPSCGATVGTPSRSSNALFGILGGIGLGIVFAGVIFTVDFSAGARSFVEFVVAGTFVAIAIAFVVGISMFVRRKVLLGFLFVTASIVVVLPAVAFGSVAFLCSSPGRP